MQILNNDDLITLISRATYIKMSMIKVFIDPLEVPKESRDQAQKAIIKLNALQDTLGFLIRPPEKGDMWYGLYKGMIVGGGKDVEK
jgi:hypothetical protein